MRSSLLFGGALLAAAGLYLASRSQRGQVAAVDAAEFVVTTAQEAWRKTRGLRARNPGNIDWIANPIKRWRGMVRKETPEEGGRFGVFDSDQNGVRAIGKELQLEERRGARTVAQQITVWAPPSENDTAAYIDSVRKALGVRADEIIDVTARLPEFVAAIIKHENGRQPYAISDIRQWVFS